MNRVATQKKYVKSSKKSQLDSVMKFLKNSAKLDRLFDLTEIRPLVTPKSSTRTKRDIRSTNDQRSDQKETQRMTQKYLKYFHTEATEDFIINYLQRIQSVKVLAENHTLELACFIYAKVIKRLQIDFSQVDDLQNYLILTFGVSLNIAQKFLLDRDIHPDSMQKLLGIKKKQLYQREIFVITKVFDCCFDVDEREFKRFVSQLYSL